MLKKTSCTILVYSLGDNDGKTKAMVDLANMLSRFSTVTIASILPYKISVFPLLKRVKTVTITSGKISSKRVVKTFHYDMTAIEASELDKFLSEIKSDVFYMPNYDSALYWLCLSHRSSDTFYILGDHGGRRNNSLKDILDKNFITDYETDYFFGSAAAKFDAIHCINPLNKNNYEKINSQVISIPNVCSLKNNNRDHASIVRKNRIIMVGRLVAIKQMDMGIRAFGMIADKIPDWTLNIFGAGSDYDLLSDLIRDLNLEDRVFLEGETMDIQKEYSKSKLYVSTSKYESFGLTYVEAMLNGLPIISFGGHIGAQYLLSENRGIVVQQDNIESLALTIVNTVKKITSGSNNLNQKIKINRLYAKSLTSKELSNLWLENFQKLLFNK